MLERVAAGLSGCVLLVGCGASPSVDTLAGERVAKMAEHQLEATHAGIATGEMTCPDLDFDPEASVRCVRTAVLSDGRQIRVLGTVTVTSVRDGGKLHVKLDDHVEEFGIAGDYLAAELKKRAQRLLGPRTGPVSCPYLSGPPGTSVRCRVEILERSLIAKVTVSGIDEDQYLTRYEFEDPLFDPRVNRALPSLLRLLRRGGVTP